jgi:hypothetical protein
MARVHCGIAESEPRNRGPIAFFKPKEVTTESAREALKRSRPGVSATEIELRVHQLMARVRTKTIKPPPPLSQPLEELTDKLYCLGTHPDIIERMWKLDAALPVSCRWALWGRPSLVHPETGVIFSVGLGTIGYAMRLPPCVLEAADADQAKTVVAGNPGQTFDITPAGPEWRFVRPRAPAVDWCRAAYEFAGSPSA